MSRHTFTNAEEVFSGNAYYERYANSNGGTRGIEFSPMIYIDLGAPAIADVDGVCAAQSVGGAVNLTIAGALASGGTVTFDTPRAVEIDSANSGDTSQTITITGTDLRGEAMTEAIAANGTTAVLGQKAFATVTQVAASASFVGNVTCGSTDILGLPFAIDDKNRVQVWFDGAADAATTVIGDTTDPATTTTNDVRGTINIAGTLDGSKKLAVYLVTKRSGKVAVHGIANA